MPIKKIIITSIFTSIYVLIGSFASMYVVVGVEGGDSRPWWVMNLDFSNEILQFVMFGLGFAIAIAYILFFVFTMVSIWKAK